MLVCVVKGCEDNFPLYVEGTKVEQTEDYADEEVFNPEFIKSLIERVDWNAFRYALSNLNIPNSLPQAPEELDLSNGELLQDLHRLLLDTHVSEGSLKCSKCSRVYPISQGIPDMLLHEDEV